MIDVWPVALRSQLVRAFRPGEPPENEAPFRTLRKHGWASPGVNVVCRENSRAAGRLTVFSMLNVDAARLAREGRGREASALAKAAARIERGAAFSRLKELISGTPVAEASAALQGDSLGMNGARMMDALRLIARETQTARKRWMVVGATLHTVAGRIAKTLPDAVILEANGEKTYVPRGLAESANRAKVGDLLALVAERLDRTHMAFEVLPAISLEAERPSDATPFGRSAPIHGLSAADAALLRRAPVALKVLVPVTIGR